MFKALILYLPQAGINHFSKVLQFLLVENMFRNQNLGINSLHCYCRGVTTSRLSQQTTLRNMYVYTQVCTYIYSHRSLIFFNLSLCFYNKPITIIHSIFAYTFFFLKNESRVLKSLFKSYLNSPS